MRLIAHAIAIGATVVAREQPAPDSKKKINFPDVCQSFSVPWTDPFSVYRALGLRLVARAQSLLDVCLRVVRCYYGTEP